MGKTFWSFIWSRFLRMQGLLIGLISLILAYILWQFSPNYKIEIAIVIPIAILLIIIILTLFDSAYESFKLIKRALPRIILGKEIYGTNGDPEVLCLLEPSELFSHDAIVSFYLLEEGFEQLLGIGKVLNIQENGNIQVILDKYSPVYQDIIDKLRKNDATILNKILVKPTVPKAYIDLYIKEIKND